MGEDKSNEKQIVDQIEKMRLLNSYDEEKFINAVHRYQLDAASNAINAFYEGYRLGKQHANKVLKVNDEDKS